MGEGFPSISYFLDCSRVGVCEFCSMICLTQPILFEGYS